MPFSKLKGNDQVKAALIRMVEHHCVPHTLLFAGPDGVGKGRFALELAALLMGPEHAEKIKTGNHPDIHIYQPEGKAHIHPVEAMRNLIAEVGMPPFEAPVKVFIIHEAHQMLPASSNALLKTLEEPTSGSYIMLLTSQPEGLLPTIVSRCRKIPFFPIPDHQIAAHAEAHWNQTPESARKTSFLAQGSLARAELIATQRKDETEQLIRQLLVQGISNYPQFIKICAQLESVYGLGKADVEEGAELPSSSVDELFEEIAAWFRDLHLIAQGGDLSLLYHHEAIEELQCAAQHEKPSLERVLEAIARARLALQRHFKLRVVLEELFFQLYPNVQSDCSIYPFRFKGALN